jgi:hypothetical protein
VVNWSTGQLEWSTTSDNRCHTQHGNKPNKKKKQGDDDEEEEKRTVVGQEVAVEMFLENKYLNKKEGLVFRYVVVCSWVLQLFVGGEEEDSRRRRRGKTIEELVQLINFTHPHHQHNTTSYNITSHHTYTYLHSLGLGLLMYLCT